MERLERLVGKKWVLPGDEDLDLYRDPYSLPEGEPARDGIRFTQIKVMKL
jgi:hypothetical protein